MRTEPLALAALLILCGLLRLAPAAGAIVPLDPDGLYHARAARAVVAGPASAAWSPYPLFHLVLGLASRALGADAMSVATLLPPLLSTLGLLSLYACVRDLTRERTALLASFFYATTPLLIETGYGPFSLVQLFLPLLVRELVRQRSLRAVGALALAFAATGAFAVWLLVFVLYSLAFGYGAHRLAAVRRPAALALLPVAAVAWLAGTLVPPSLPVAGPAFSVDAIGVGVLFLLVFLESFESDPRLARFLIVLAGTCLFGHLLGRAFQVELLATAALALVAMEAIGASIFVEKGTAAIYRATAMVAILAFSLLHAWSVSDGMRPPVAYDELSAASRLSLPADAVVLSDEQGMELVATVSPVRAMLTRETLDRKRWGDFRVDMAAANVTCGYVRRYNITHVLLSPRVRARYPYALKYSGLPRVDIPDAPGSVSLVEVGAYCRHRAV